MLSRHRAARARGSITIPSRRSFSWRTKRLYDPGHDSSIYRSPMSYARPAISYSSKTLRRSYFWKRGHFLNQYTQSPEWRLLSSWGRSLDASRSGEGRPKDAREDMEKHEYDWYGEWQRRHAESLKHFEQFKKMIDEDPYEALFGRRLVSSGFFLSFSERPLSYYSKYTFCKPTLTRERKC